MKILICTNHSYMFWQFRKELVQELLKNNEVILSAPFTGHEDDLAELGCHVIDTDIDRRGINPKTDIKLFLFYRNLLKKVQPDLVITYSIKPNVYCGLACRLQKITYCANVQGLGTAFQKDGIAQIATILYRTALKKAKTTFFENAANAKEFCDRKIQKASAQTILHGAGVNLDYYNDQSYPNNDKLHFLYLGRIMKEKGIDELFDAAKKLKSEGADFVLDLVGFYEDEYKVQTEQLVKDGIAVFHGFHPDPRPFYAASDCVVLPSYHEGMSNVLLEAAATGRPVITSNIAGCKEAVDENKSGFLCESKNAEGLYLSMKKMLSLSQKERAAMGQHGRKFVKQYFNKEDVVRATVQHLF